MNLINIFLKTSTVTDLSYTRRLFLYLLPYKKELFIAIITSIPAAMMEGALAYFSGPFLDNVLKNHDYSLLLWGPVLIIGSVVIQGIFLYVNQYLMAKVSASSTQDLQQELYYHLTDMDVQYFTNNSSGNLFTRYYNDPYFLKKIIAMYAQSMVIQFFTVVGLSAVLFYRNWVFALISLAIISLIAIPISLISNKLRQLNHVSQEVSAGLINRLQESLYGSKLLHLYMLQTYQKKRFDKALQELYVNNMRTQKAAILIRPLTQLVAAIGVGTIILLGGLQIQSGQMTPGEMTSFIIALILLYKPFKTLGGMVGKTEKLMAPAERIFALLDKKSELIEADLPVEVHSFSRLDVQNVSFAYHNFSVLSKKKQIKPKNQKIVLQNVSFSVLPKETIALVGANGSGKTTMVDLIARLMDPTDGQILLNGIDLRQVSLQSLRQAIAYVSQDTVLFEGSIRENIRLGRLDATDEEIEEAAQKAQLMDWIQQLPDGWDTPVGERGVLLSGGQRQRITIARAFVRNAPLLILDEATSALDTESEASVQKALKELMYDRTVIVIAHRLTNVVHADRIHVFQNGQIVETGTHKELLAKDGQYARFYQATLYEDAMNTAEDALATTF